MKLLKGLVTGAVVSAAAVAVAKVIVDDLEKRKELDEFLIPSQEDAIEMEVESSEEIEEETKEVSESDQDE